MTDAPRLSLPDYFMGIALAVRKRANCHGNRVGAVVVVEGHIVSTGYNGTPAKFKNCLDGGCERCHNRDKFPSGTSYDLCICVHAEQNALLAAARFGIQLEGGELYTTMQPCFGCTKEMLQARIKKVYYLHPWVYPDPLWQSAYEEITRHIPEGMHALTLPDPEESWAISTKRKRSNPN